MIVLRSMSGEVAIMKKKTMIECLGNVTDYRKGNGTEHKLIDIMCIAILAVICGADHWTEVEKFGEAKKEWLRTFLELPFGIPSHDTFGRVFAAIDPKEFHNAFIEWVQSLSEIIRGQVIAIDGKTARRSKDKANGKAALHVVSAWANDNRMVLGQLKVTDKSNEITAIPALLKMLDINGCIITIDAMGTQKDIAKEIIAGGADYLLALKKNHKTLHDDVELYFKEEILTQTKQELEKKGSYFKMLDNSHGRLEKREYYVHNDVSWMSQKGEWAGLKGIGLCISHRTEGEKTSVEYSYSLISIKNCTAKQYGTSKRSHWGVENSLHWVLDMAFREDESRARKDHSGENLNVMRHMALNLLKQEKTLKVGIKSKRLNCGWDESYLLKVLEISNIGKSTK